MTVRFKESFARDLRAIQDQGLLRRARSVVEAVEGSTSLASVAGLKRLKGAKTYYRIRVGDYRMGLTVEGDVVTFVRFLHRKEIYRYFP